MTIPSWADILTAIRSYGIFTSTGRENGYIFLPGFVLSGRASARIISLYGQLFITFYLEEGVSLPMFNLTRQERIVVIFLIGAVILGGAKLYYRNVVRDRVEPEVVESGMKAADDVGVTVDIAGAVWRPGVYRLKAGARVKDVVAKAGPRGDANLEVINLAVPLRDGQKIVVPIKPGAVTTARDLSGEIKTLVPSRSRGSKINLNTATPAELETLPGIGPVRAQAIANYRNQHKGFKNIEELKNIEGIGEKTFRKIEKRLSVY